jgi:hypothetical protein
MKIKELIEISLLVLKIFSLIFFVLGVPIFFAIGLGFICAPLYSHGILTGRLWGSPFNWGGAVVGFCSGGLIMSWILSIGD